MPNVFVSSLVYLNFIGIRLLIKVACNNCKAMFPVFSLPGVEIEYWFEDILVTILDVKQCSCHLPEIIADKLLPLALLSPRSVKGSKPPRENFLENMGRVTKKRSIFSMSSSKVIAQREEVTGVAKTSSAS